MLLAIDVGNTETKFGILDEDGSVLQMWRVRTLIDRTPDELGVFITQLFAVAKLELRTIDRIVIASVVPKLDFALVGACKRFFSLTPTMLAPEKQRLIQIESERAAEVGADLVAAAIGGAARYGTPLIIASYGTATVFTAISRAGAFLGAAIAPGINVSIDALVGRTAKLPQIAFDPPQRAIGRNTVEALQAGIMLGVVGATRLLVERFNEELGGRTRVIATGGLAEVVARSCPAIDIVDPHLSMLGLYLFANAIRTA
uniref:Type III pantothenate kinase n=1 Tax=mine drainage metagenome TaxID=410659 RepID=E6PHF8_9ZZZZ